VHRPEANVGEGFLSTKKDKRIIKHSSFVSKIQKANKQPLKRRRPSKKLITTLESLADALPTLDADVDGNIQQLREGKVRHKSLKSRPGALKRKERVVKGELERFGVNMAKLATVTEKSNPPTESGKGAKKKNETETETSAQPSAPTSTTNRWAALRGYISATMEQNPAFTPTPQS
jgi:hypothetical protein